jgi:phage baseplate assembly protein gpV
MHGKISEELRTTGPLGGAHFRAGLVAERDVAGCRVRVRFPDRDNLLSHRLPVVVRASQDDKRYHLPDLDEQVACLMDALDEDGVVLGAIYSTVDAPPAGMTGDKDHVTYKDGTKIEYDRAEHVFDALFMDGADIQYDAAAHVLKHTAQDEAEIHYDAAAHAGLVQLPAGSTLTVQLGSLVTLVLNANGTVELRAATITAIATAAATIQAPAIALKGVVTVT